MRFSTPIEISPFPFQLTPQSHIVVLGSCFAEHIGQRLACALPLDRVSVNPFGVLYHPTVLARALARIAFASALPEDIFFEGRDGLWHSWWHASAFSAPTREECQRLVEASLKQAHEVLQKADLLILTLSTDHGYYLKEKLSWGSLVANCHKMPGNLFDEKVTSLDASIGVWESLLPFIKVRYPQLHILWTVSPYRYAKHGMHESQLSKARLHLMIDHLIHAEIPIENGFSQEADSKEITNEWESRKKMSDIFEKTSEIFGKTSEFFEKTSEIFLKKSDVFAQHSELPSEKNRQNSPKGKEKKSDVTTSSLSTSTGRWQYYFPAYEILLDELRDYRFFAPDMLHPSEQAVDYIWEKFRETVFSSELNDCASHLYSIRQALAHRPLHPESEDYRKFYTQTQQRIAEFTRKFGFAPQ
jgi:putative lipoprotein